MRACKGRLAEVLLLGWMIWGLSACGGSSYDPGETTASACQDGDDNDGDGQVDCADPDCAGFVFCLPPTELTASDCQNEVDDDGDGATDCADEDCRGFVFCAGNQTEDSAAACQDMADNDADGRIDCFDPDCEKFAFCQGVAEDTEDLCQNGQDDDEDGATDCADGECAGFDFCGQAAGEQTPGACQDGADNDSDGLTDCLDSDCLGYVFCLPGTESSASRCRDEQDNDSDGQIDCADPDCQGYTFCADGGESGETACADQADNDADGLVDCDDPGCWPWGFCQHYHGYPLVDHWLETFDGIERPALPFAEAEAVCSGLGGRLPTVTELWRNNASGGTGDLSDNTAANWLWTRIASATPDRRVVVRLSDGAVAYQLDQTATRYRCVWPDAAGAGFDAARCHGDPAAPCWAFGRFWNVDAEDRPAVDYAAAVNECAFLGASIPVVAEWGRLIHAGLPAGSDRWLWAANAMYWYSGNYGMALVRWTEAVQAHWQWANAQAWGAISQGNTDRNFRCVGLADPAAFPAPDVECAGDCAAVDQRRSTLLADQADRPGLQMFEAAADCRAAGGELPNLAEATELIHAGWSGGSTAWLWLSDANYWFDGTNGNYGHAVFQWLEAGAPWWFFASGVGGLSPAATARDYRCVYRPSGPALPPCQANQIVNQTEAGYVCAPKANGSSAGQAHVIEIVDDFGNAWDGIQRDQATWADAQATCEAAGGRLPRASELYAVRFQDNPQDPIGDVTSTSPLWTISTTAAVGNRVLVRVSDGASSQTTEDTLQYFRCLWPSSRGQVLAAANCYGPPDGPCFSTAAGLVADRYDRVAVDAAGAIEECQVLGGKLPDMRELAELIRAGLPNGGDRWLWVAEPIFWYATGYGYALARWAGDGAESWQFTSPETGGLSWPTDFRNFRCVFSTRLR